MPIYKLYQIDSFTKTKFKGNPAGVVVNAAGLSDAQMQSIARELNNSETAFLLPADDVNCDGVIRYFSPTVEVPICGHATVAAMYAKAQEEGIDNAVFQMKTNVGVLPFEIESHNGEIKVWMTQGAIEIGPELSTDQQARLLSYLGVSEADLDQRCPIQAASTGHGKVMIGINSKQTLDNLTPNFSELAKLSEEIGVNGYFVFTLNSADADVLSHGRMFAPAIGINEDPVTGNANGPLGAYLVHSQIVKVSGDTFSFNGKQGEAIGRDGIVEVSVAVSEEKPVQVKIAGSAVTVFTTTIDMPEQ